MRQRNLRECFDSLKNIGRLEHWRFSEHFGLPGRHWFPPYFGLCQHGRHVAILIKNI